MKNCKVYYTPVPGKIKPGMAFFRKKGGEGLDLEIMRGRLDYGEI